MIFTLSYQCLHSLAALIIAPVRIQIVSTMIAPRPRRRYGHPSDHVIKQKRTVTARWRYSLLCPEYTTSCKSSRVYIQPWAAIIMCGQRPQDLLSHITWLAAVTYFWNSCLPNAPGSPDIRQTNCTARNYAINTTLRQIHTKTKVEHYISVDYFKVIGSCGRTLVILSQRKEVRYEYICGLFGRNRLLWAKLTTFLKSQ